MAQRFVGVAASASPGAMLPLRRDAAIAEAGRRVIGTAGSDVPDPPDAPHHSSGRITQAGVTTKDMVLPAAGGAALDGDVLGGERRAAAHTLVAPSPTALERIARPPHAHMQPFPLSCNSLTQATSHKSVVRPNGTSRDESRVSLSSE